MEKQMFCLVNVFIFTSLWISYVYRASCLLSWKHTYVELGNMVLAMIWCCFSCWSYPTSNTVFSCCHLLLLRFSVKWNLFHGALMLSHRHFLQKPRKCSLIAIYYPWSEIYAVVRRQPSEIEEVCYGYEGARMVCSYYWNETNMYL